MAEEQLCSSCGTPVTGRFCARCGHPTGIDAPARDWRAGTAERPRVQAAPPREPVVPPPARTTPGAPRFPLFADEITPSARGPLPTEQGEDDTAIAPAVEAGPLGPGPGAYAAPPAHRGQGRTRARVPLAAGAAALLVAVLALGSWLLLRSPDTAVDGTASPGTTPGATQAGGASGEATASTEPDQSTAPSASTRAGEAVSLVPGTVANAPRTAPPNEDVHGNTTTYHAANMLDGDPATTWRMAGDGSGTELTFTLPEPSAVVEVGLVNGYAKTSTEGSTTFDWYAGNRRVLAVEWVFDDGTTVRQDLTEGRALQSMRVGPVTTSAVRLRLVDVSPPGSGPAARNYTAVSEVALLGSPA